MEKRKVIVLSIQKNEIIIRKKKTRSNLIAICSILIILFTMCFSIEKNFKVLTNNMIKIYNPVSSLYNDNSDIVFTSGGILEKDSVNLKLPVKAATYRIEKDGTILFDIVSSIMVTACDSGIVEMVGNTVDNKKFIKIKHAVQIETIIENLDIVGVKVGDIVKSGQDIATAKIGEIISLKIYQNNIQVSNIKINQSKIVWE